MISSYKALISFNLTSLKLKLFIINYFLLILELIILVEAYSVVIFNIKDFSIEVNFFKTLTLRPFIFSIEEAASFLRVIFRRFNSSFFILLLLNFFFNIIIIIYPS